MSAAVPNIPGALRALPNFLVWSLVQKEGEPKPRKVPFYASGKPRSGAQGTQADRDSLVSFDAACEALARGRYSGIGFAPLPGDGIVALDFDGCLIGGKLDPRVAAIIAGTYAEVSPSGTGIRAFMLGDLRSRKDNAGKRDRNSDGTRKDGQFDIEFFGTNGFVTITGNHTDECAMLGLENYVAPLTPAAAGLYKARFGDSGAFALPARSGFDHGADLFGEGDDGQPGSELALVDADLSMLPPDTLGWTIEQAREYLFDCDANAPRADWVNALMALHHELGGAPEALDLADEWSATSDENYGGREDVEGRWFSFGKGHGGGTITGRWLLKWRLEFLTHKKYDAAAKWKQELAQAPDEFSIRERVCPQIAKDVDLDEMGREALAQALLSAFTRTGTKYPIAQCRKLLAPVAPRSQSSASRLPTWLDGWVYVSEDDKFFRVDSAEWLSMQGFNAKFNREVMNAEGEVIKSAAWLALEDHGIPTVTKSMYVPWAGGTFDTAGIACVNTYRPSGVPVAVDSLTPGDKHAVSLLMRHLRLLAGDREEVVSILVDWMAHNVQKPGVKIRWCPVIKGVEGDGKSLIGDLMASVMGRSNVRTISSKVLATDFTGWAEGAAIGVLEEIKLTGHNKFDVMNSLKPFITNDSIEVHRKGKDTYETMNVTNYIAFTNFVDALPITDTDRRYLVLFTPFMDRNEMARAIRQGGDPIEVLGDYFAALHAALQGHVCGIRKWLVDHEISAAFKPNSQAPMTAEKQVMVSMTVSEDESEVRDLLETGGPGYSVACFASSYLVQGLLTTGSDVSLKTSSWNHLLIRMGYTKLPKKVKWRGKTENVWVKGHRLLDNDEARELLEKTMVGVEDFGDLTGGD